MNPGHKVRMKAFSRYAPYYEMENDESKEADIIRCWKDSKYRGDHPFVSGKHLTQNEDPPDFVLKTNEDSVVGVEITELVDQQTVSDWHKGNQHYYMWSSEEIPKRVEAILRKKEGKLLKKHQGDLSAFDDMLLLIHTDEGTLRFEMIEEAFKEQILTSSVFSQIDIIMPPKPRCQGYLEGDPENHPLSDRNVNQLYQLKCQPVYGGHCR